MPSLDTLEPIVYPNVTEVFVAFGFENGMPAISGGTLSALPSPSSWMLLGYTANARASQDDKPEGQRLAAEYSASIISLGAKEDVIRGSFICSSGANVKKFIQAAFRSTSESVIGSQHRSDCQPVIYIAYGAVSQCENGRSFARAARHAMITRLTLQVRMNAPVMVEYEAWPLCIQDDVTAPSATLANHAALVAAGGKPYSYYDTTLNVTDYSSGQVYDFMPIVDGFSLTWVTELERWARRNLTEVDDDASNPLYRAPRMIVPVGNDAAIHFSMASKFPQQFVRSDRKIGNIVCSFANTSGSIAFALTNNRLSNRAVEAAMNSDVGFEAGIYSGLVTVN
jgi:hypothetical protein